MKLHNYENYNFQTKFWIKQQQQNSSLSYTYIHQLPLHPPNNIGLNGEDNTYTISITSILNAIYIITGIAIVRQDLGLNNTKKNFTFWLFFILCLHLLITTASTYYLIILGEKYLASYMIFNIAVAVWAIGFNSRMVHTGRKTTLNMI